MPKLTIQTMKHPAKTIHRCALKRDKLVCVPRANTPRRYPHSRSRIVYIGTTKAGASRIAASAAAKAKQLLDDHGVKRLDFYVVGCAPRQYVATWRNWSGG